MMIKILCLMCWAAVLLVCGVSVASAQDQEPGTIRVEGYAEVHAMADLATFEVAIRTADIDPAAARQKNQQQMRNVLDVIDGLDAEDTNVAMHSFDVERENIAPKFDDPRYETRCKRVLVITLRQVDQADELIDELVDLGFEFEVDWRVEDRVDLEKTALAQAVEDAKAKAEVALQILDQELGQAERINVYSTWRQRARNQYTGGLFGTDDEVVRSRSQPGNVWLNVTVEVNFMIGD